VKATTEKDRIDETLDDILTLDEVGLSALHARYYPQVYQFVYYRLQDDELSETVTRDVFLELLREARNTASQQRHLRGWLMSCASRRVNEQLQTGIMAYEGEGVTSYQAPQEEMVINPEAEELSRKQFLAAAPRSQRKNKPASLKRLKWTAAVLAGVLLLAFAASLVASLQVTPQSSLYRVRRLLEEARLVLAGSAAQRLEIEMAIDRDRLSEVNTLIEAGRGPLQVTLVGGLSGMSDDEWVVGDIPVAVSPEAQLIGQIEPGMVVQVAGVLQPDGVVRAKRIQPREYRLSGKIQRIQDELWIVDTIPIRVTPETILRGEAAAGSRAELVVYRLLDDSLVARWIEVGD
jgi:hypothetical protein